MYCTRQYCELVAVYHNMYSVRILVTGRIHCVINSVCNVVYYDLRIDVTTCTHMTFSRKCVSYVYAYYRIIITMHICITMTM